MVLLIKIIMSVMKVATYIITSITALSIRLDAILVIMSVSIFKSDIILYVIRVHLIISQTIFRPY